MEKPITQIKIAEILGVTPSLVCQLFSGKTPVSWKMAEKLADLFADLYPERSIREWRYSRPDEIRRAFVEYEDVV